MKVTDTDRLQFFSGVKSTLDLSHASAVATLTIDTTTYPCTWTGTATLSDDGEEWSREARTSNWFAGPVATTQPGDVVLALGAHDVELRVTVSGATLTYKLPSIAVRA